MSKASLILAFTLLAPAAWGATYTFSSPSYNSVINFVTCTSGPCGNYTTSMKLTGSFTTASSLAANLALTDITAQIASYSFSDGINSYSSANPAARIDRFQIATDGSGNISQYNLLLELWESGTSPHAVGDRVALIAIGNAPTLVAAANNTPCVAVGTSPTSSVSDSCVSDTNDDGVSQARAASGAWTNNSTPTTSVPTLGAYATIGLGLLLMLSGWYAARRRETGSAQS